VPLETHLEASLIESDIGARQSGSELASLERSACGQFESA
jgi:hypothetical protein